MKRWLLSILAGGILLVAAAGPALADAGAPGTTFPEQPGANVQTACSAVATNPGTADEGASNPAPTAEAIQAGLFADACGG